MSVAAVRVSRRGGMQRMAAGAVLIALAGCAADSSARMRRVQGGVFLQDRNPLPAGSLVVIRLQDVSRMDVPAVVLQERRIEAGDNRQPPFVFDFGIEPERIDPRARYTVAARITDAGGRLLYINDIAYPVLTQGAGDMTRLVLQRVHRP